MPTIVSPTFLQADLRLVVSDMDGTLLTSKSQQPAGLPDLIADLTARGILFVPASGRQLASLQREFPSLGTFIAENGAVCMYRGTVIGAEYVPREAARAVVGNARELGAGTHAIWCTPEVAYVESTDPQFLKAAAPYYATIEPVDDLLEVDAEPVKVAVYAPEQAAQAHSRLAQRMGSRSAGDEQDGDGQAGGELHGYTLAQSSPDWVDMFAATCDKGRAVRTLMSRLTIDAAQVAAFGDYLNDLPLLEAVEWSFAMANAHPSVQATARFCAPSNDDAGVLQVLHSWLSARLALQPAVEHSDHTRENGNPNHHCGGSKTITDNRERLLITDQHDGAREGHPEQ